MPKTYLVRELLSSPKNKNSTRELVGPIAASSSNEILSILCVLFTFIGYFPHPSFKVQQLTSYFCLLLGI